MFYPNIDLANPVAPAGALMLANEPNAEPIAPKAELCCALAAAKLL
jgi:hypothetical protein